MIVFAATFASALGLSWLSSRGDERTYVDRIYGETERTFKAAIDPRYHSKAEEVSRVISRLVVIEAIRGGALFDDTGHVQQTFGETPVTSVASIEASGSFTFPIPELQRVEFYYPPGRTGTPFHLIARVDIGAMSALEGRSTERILMTSLAAAVAGGAFAWAFVWLFVALPVRRLRLTMDRIVADPATSDSADPLRSGPSEIGALAGTLERFRGMLADIWRTKVIVADAILEQAPVAVVQLAADGSPTFANPAAETLFERDIIRTQATVPLVVRDVETGNRSVLKDHLDLYPETLRVIEIATSGGPRFAAAGGLMVGADSRTPTTVALITDITATHRAKLAAQADRASEAARLRLSQRREFELKLMLESCLSLLTGPDRPKPAHLDPLPFAVEWLKSAREAGLIANPELPTDEGPMVEGATEDMKAVIRLALLVAYARCPTVPVMLSIDARGINFETAGVTIRAQSVDPSLDPKTAGPTADWQLAFAALRGAIRRVNGQLTEFEAGEPGVSIKMVLRGASERLAAVKAR